MNVIEGRQKSTPEVCENWRCCCWERKEKDEDERKKRINTAYRGRASARGRPAVVERHCPNGWKQLPKDVVVLAVATSDKVRLPSANAASERAENRRGRNEIE